LDDNSKAAWELKAYNWISLCEDEIATWHDCKDFSVNKYILDWKTNRRSSRGGWYSTGPGINIAMSIATRDRGKVFRMYEYASFDANSFIGGFYATDNNLALGMTICHEMAHAVQFYRIFALGYKRGAPHGPDFRNPYKTLRHRVLNNKLPNQQLIKKQYDNSVNNISGKVVTTKELNHLFGITA
jgi:hypothetical protein